MSEDMREKELRKPISRGELDRRFAAVREAMEREKLDCLIMQSHNQFLGGMTRYFTGVPATNGYTMTVILRAESSSSSLKDWNSLPSTLYPYL